MPEIEKYPYQLATPEQRALGAFWWCIHHEIKLEQLIEPIERRVEYIQKCKAEHERETRLRAMRPVKGPLSPAFIKADADWLKADADRQKANADRQKANADRQKAYADWLKANADWQKADADHAAEIEALFAVECADVQWGPGGLVFPEVTR